MDQAERTLRRLVMQVDERRAPRTNATVNQLLDEHFALATLEINTIETYRSAAEIHIRPLIGDVKVGSLNAKLFDSSYAELQRCRIHCDGRPLVDHRTRSPMSAMSGAARSAEVEPPAAHRERSGPDPQRRRKDALWGLLICLTKVTGFRRGELCAIRWRHVDFDAGVLGPGVLGRAIGQRNGRTWEKDTKDHQNDGSHWTQRQSDCLPHITWHAKNKPRPRDYPLPRMPSSTLLPFRNDSRSPEELANSGVQIVSPAPTCRGTDDLVAFEWRTIVGGLPREWARPIDKISIRTVPNPSRQRR